MTQDLDIKGTFKVLFDGSRSALGAEAGGCLRIEQPWMWSQFVEAHLTGEGEPIGVYPMVYGTVQGDEGWLVKWGCVDIDAGEAQSKLHAKNLYLVLETFGIKGWIERSRTKGFHVWIFADRWIPAGTMRTALLGACQIVDAPSGEVNPKQAKLKEGQLGNYVRLPYPGHLKDSHILHQQMRRVMVDPALLLPIALGNFVSRAFNSRCGSGPLESLADAYVAPERPIQRREWKGVPKKDEGIAGYVRWMEKQEEGNRNVGLFWAACRCLEAGDYDLEPLVEAAITAGLPEWEARRTVESAESLY